MSGSWSSALSSNRSSSSWLGTARVVSSCGYCVARLAASLFEGVLVRLKRNSVSILERVKDWVVWS